MSSDDSIRELDVSDSLMAKLVEAGFLTIAEVNASLKDRSLKDKVKKCGDECVRDIENAIAKYEAHIQYFTQVDYADANRFNELSRRVDRARKILLGKKRITKELSNQEIKETVLKFYRDAFNFLHAYRGMIRPDAKNLWSKVNAARTKEQVV